MVRKPEFSGDLVAKAKIFYRKQLHRDTIKVNWLTKLMWITVILHFRILNHQKMRNCYLVTIPVSVNIAVTQ